MTEALKDAITRVIGVVLLAVAVTSLGYSIYLSVQQDQRNEELVAYVKCQQAWTTFLHTAITTGRTANTEAQAALDNLIETISAAKSREESAAALARYKYARAEQKKAQDENPLPPPPEEVCHL